MCARKVTLSRKWWKYSVSAAPGFYRLMNDNVFEVVRVRGRVRIIKSSFDAWLDGEMEEE